MPNLKVLQLVASFRNGGIERLLIGTLEPLRERGVDSVVVSLTGDLERADLLREKGFVVRRLHSEYKSIRHDVLPDKAFVESARKVLDEERPDLIHGHHYHAIVTAHTLGRMARRPHVVTNHNLQEPWQTAPGFWPAWFRRLMRTALRTAAHNVFISEAVREDVERFAGPLRGTVVENCIDDRFWSVPADAPRSLDVAFVGRMHPQKNPLMAVRALAAVAAGRPLKATMSGSGDLLEPTRALVRELGMEERIDVRGEQSEAEILQTLARTKVLYLPSQWEGFGIAAAEGMAAGCACVLSTSPGFVRTFGGIDGVAFADPDDLEANRDRLLEALDDAHPRDRSELRARFGTEHFVGALERVYREAARGR